MRICLSTRGQLFATFSTLEIIHHTERVPHFGKGLFRAALIKREKKNMFCPFVNPECEWDFGQLQFARAFE